MEDNGYNNNLIKRTNWKIRRAQLIPNEENPDICPECGANTKYDQDKAEICCNDCGLVVKASIPYSGIKHIHHHYGILLQHG